MKFKNQLYPVIIAPTHIPELLDIRVCDTGVWFGASTTLTRLEQILNEQIASLPQHKTRVYCQIVEMMRWFAGHQIRNVSVCCKQYLTVPK